MSAALKYALSQTLILPFAQVDGDNDTPPPSTPKPAAPAVPTAQETANPNPARTSAYDGRTLKPGEDPRPAATPPVTSTPAAEADETAFHARLYNAMTLCGITDGELKAYGAGILSSYGEIEEFQHMDIRPLDLRAMGTTQYDITRYQDVLFRAESMDHLEDVAGAFFDSCTDDSITALLS
jgi:hypothetical protein